MEIIKPGKSNEVPKFFITTCDKGYGRGCGAELKVFPEDCFKCPYGGLPMQYLSFYCDHCGLMLTPDYDRVSPEHISPAWGEETLKNYTNVKTEDNCPPWNAAKFPSNNAFDKKHGIKSWYT